MSEWQPIETAPKDGVPIKCRRIYGEREAWSGFAVWRTVRFRELKTFNPVGGLMEHPGYDATGWMYPDIDKRVPEPTHWMPNGDRT